MKSPAWAWAIRITVGAVFCALLFQSWHAAEADILAASARPGDLDRAITLEPENETYRMRKASADLFAEGVSPARTETELREVLKQNPRNAEAIMDLGLLAESRRDNVEAERLLRQAAHFDLTFKPAWTIINFYFRTNQLEKMWPEVRKALNTTTKPDMLYFDVQPVYDLCWRAGADPQKMVTLIPPNPQALLSYFFYSVWHDHLDGAAVAYPLAFPFADPAIQLHGAVFGDFANMLFLAHRTDESVRVWNQLVAKGFLSSTEIHPDRAESIANSDFQFPFERPPFGWLASGSGEVATTYTPHSVLIDFSGKQPDVAQVLYKNLPVIPGRDYFLTWNADGSRITRPSDPKEIGLAIRFFDGDRPLSAVCSAFLAKEKDRGCSFHVPEGVRAFSMKLLAERQQGSVRIRGTLQINGFHLAFRSGQISLLNVAKTMLRNNISA